MSGAAQDEPRLDRILGMVDALRAELEELQSLSQEVPKLVARTEELEQFVDGLKPDGADPVVRRAEHHYALGAMEAGWKEGDNQVREELATTQTLVQELKARVDEFAALKAQVDFVVARVPDDLQSQWIQGLYLELEQRVQEDVKRCLDATLKEYRRDSSTTHQQNQLDGVTERMNNFGVTISGVRFEIDTINEGLRELEAKLEGAPMPRMARGAARGGMRGIPLNGRPAEAEDVSVEGNAGATGSARGRRGDRRLSFEDERAPDGTPYGAAYGRGSGGRPSMFRVDQEAGGRAEDEQWAPPPPRRYYLTASQVLDTQFTSEDCPPSLKDGDLSATPDPKQALRETRAQPVQRAGAGAIGDCRSRMSGRQMGRHTVRRTGAGPADDRRCSGSTKRQVDGPRMSSGPHRLQGGTTLRLLKCSILNSRVKIARHH
jgi:hypothetical protein